MLTGKLPEWPYQWPFPGHERLRQRHPDLVELVRKATELNPRRRFRDAAAMLAAFKKIKAKVLKHAERQAERRRKPTKKKAKPRPKTRQPTR